MFVTLVEDSVSLLWELVNFWEADDRVRTFLVVVLVELVERHVSVPQEFWSIIDEVCLVDTGLQLEEFEASECLEAIPADDAAIVLPWNVTAEFELSDWDSIDKMDSAVFLLLFVDVEQLEQIVVIFDKTSLGIVCATALPSSDV